jgi:hypothetical protein
MVVNMHLFWSDLNDGSILLVQLSTVEDELTVVGEELRSRTGSSRSNQQVLGPECENGRERDAPNRKE